MSVRSGGRSCYVKLLGCNQDYLINRRFIRFDPRYREENRVLVIQEINGVLADLERQGPTKKGKSGKKVTISIPCKHAGHLRAKEKVCQFLVNPGEDDSSCCCHEDACLAHSLCPAHLDSADNGGASRAEREHYSAH